MKGRMASHQAAGRTAAPSRRVATIATAAAAANQPRPQPASPRPAAPPASSAPRAQSSLAGARRATTTAAVALAPAAAPASLAPRSSPPPPPPPLDVVIAGAGIGGLVLALALLRRAEPGAVRLRIFERDLTAIRGEGKYRGPIQVQSNALAALEAIDPVAADAVMAAGCVTGDRVNGLCDGVSGDWYVKFDTFHPAADRGLPVTRVISRVTLQRILAEAVERAAREHESARASAASGAAAAAAASHGGGGSPFGAPFGERSAPLLTIEGDARVVAYEDGTGSRGDKVAVTLADGRVFSADLLVGADGIRSRVRRLLRLGPDSVPPPGAPPSLESLASFSDDDAASAALAQAALAAATAAGADGAPPPPPSSRDDPRDAPIYAGYTCYTGISEFTPPDIDVVGYRVFLGNRKYFVSSDVGEGRMQWYAFHSEPAGGSDGAASKKARLLRLFGHWCPDVVDLIKATPEGDVLRRDIYDRPPIFSWGKGRVLLLGDSAHAMQPNLGQGGCMAIEDAFELGEIVRENLLEGRLAREQRAAAGGGSGSGNGAGVDGAGADGQDAPAFDAGSVRRKYESRRIVRAGAIHGMARSAAFMASTYKALLGEGLGPAGEWAARRLRIPHPGRVVGQAVLSLTMPLVLEWGLGGNAAALTRARAPSCRLTDTPRGFSARELREELLKDDAALLRRAKARWLLLAERAPSGPGADPTSTSEVKGVAIDGAGAVVGRSADAAAAAAGGLPPAADGSGDDAAAAAQSAAAAASPAAALCVDDAAVAPNHARVWRDPNTGDHLLHDLGAPSGTWVNGRRIAAGARATVLKPGDVVEFGRSPSAEPFRVRLLHESLSDQGVSGARYTTMVIGARRATGAEDAEAAAALEAARGAAAVAEAAAAAAARQGTVAAAARASR